MTFAALQCFEWAELLIGRKAIELDSYHRCPVQPTPDQTNYIAILAPGIDSSRAACDADLNP